MQFENVHYDDENNVISWEPPNSSWNPWISQPTVVEGAEEYMQPPPTSEQFYEEFQAKWEDTSFTSMLEKRKDLPVYQHKQQLLDLVKDNQVIIVRGATGCGKTTQVKNYRCWNSCWWHRANLSKNCDRFIFLFTFCLNDIDLILMDFH